MDPKEHLNDEQEQGVLVHDEIDRASSEFAEGEDPKDDDPESSSGEAINEKELAHADKFSTVGNLSDRGFFGTSFTLSRLFSRNSLEYHPDEEQANEDDEVEEQHQTLSRLFGSFMTSSMNLDMALNEVEVRGRLEEVPSGVFARTQSLSLLFQNSESFRPDSIREDQPYQLVAPKILGKEEITCVHRTINGSILGSAALIVLFFFVSVDYKEWHELSFLQIIWRTVADNWAAYERVLENNPIRTKMIISGCVYTMGDWIAQCYEGERILEVNLLRAARSGLVGFFLHGSLSHFYYNLCEWLFPWQGWWVVPLKVLFDQTIWAGTWNTIYYVMLGLLRFESPSRIMLQLRTTFVPLITAGWKLWPFAHIITYGVIPVEQRLAWVDLVELVWVIILSMYSNNKPATDKPDSEEVLDFEKNGMYKAAPDHVLQAKSS